MQRVIQSWIQINRDDSRLINTTQVRNTALQQPDIESATPYFQFSSITLDRVAMQELEYEIGMSCQKRAC